MKRLIKKLWYRRQLATLETQMHFWEISYQDYQLKKAALEEKING